MPYSKLRCGVNKVNYPYVDYLFDKYVYLQNFKKFKFGVVLYLAISPPKLCDSWVAKYGPAVVCSNFVLAPSVQNCNAVLE